MKALLPVLLLIATPALGFEMTRAEATGALNALAQIGQYKTAIKQAGQDIAVDRFLDVSTAMRSTLMRDVTVLRGIVQETAKLQEEAKIRSDARPVSEAERLADFNSEISGIALEKVPVEGLVFFAEADLQLDKNPQITPLLGSALSVLMTPPAKSTLKSEIKPEGPAK